MMKKVLKYSVVLLAMALMCSSANAQSKSFKMAQWNEIQRAIIKELNKSYVDTLPVDRMQRAAIDAMLATLDPYTVYIPEEENEDLQMMVHKSYGGIGAVIYKPEKNGPVIINEPYSGSPAQKYGLHCGDEIIAIDGNTVYGLETKECTDRMKGQPGTEVVFTVRRVRTGLVEEVKVIRERIHLPDVEYAGMIAPHTGYILQTGFTEGVSDVIRQEVINLKKAGMDTLVLDLRGNGGGLLSEAVNIVSLFVPKGSKVVTSKGINNGSYYEYKTYTSPLDLKMPIIVLVDSGSASASEIVSGALQDLDRATIMGHRTFGKGLVQSIKQLPYGGQLKLTTAKYYTPSGRCVQAIDYSHRNEDGSVGYIPDSLTHTFSTAHGRTVKDGGGITPDVEIEGRTYSDIVYRLVIGGTVQNYVLEYVRNHESIAPIEDFHFDDIDGFLEFAANDLKTEQLREELAKMDPSEIVSFIEEEIAVRYYFQKAGVQIRLRYDDILKKALTSPLISW